MFRAAVGCRGLPVAGRRLSVSAVSQMPRIIRPRTLKEEDDISAAEPVYPASLTSKAASAEGRWDMFLAGRAAAGAPVDVRVGAYFGNVRLVSTYCMLLARKKMIF